jgi:hypothetical protein
VADDLRRFLDGQRPKASGSFAFWRRLVFGR